MSTRRFTTTVVGFGALAGSLMVLPGVLDAAGGSSPSGTGPVGPPAEECAMNGFPGTLGIRDESPGNPDPEIVDVPDSGGAEITFDYSNFNEDNEPETVTVTFTGNITVVGIVVKAGQAEVPDGSGPPFVVTTDQGISHVTVCYTLGTTTTTTIPATTTTTTIPATTTTTTIPGTTTTSVSPTTSIAATTPRLPRPLPRPPRRPRRPRRRRRQPPTRRRPLRGRHHHDRPAAEHRHAAEHR